MIEKLKRISRILFVNLIILGVGVVLCELIFGNWVHSNKLNKLNIVRAQTIKYNIEHLYRSSSPTVIYTRDEYGLRGSFKDPSEIDILTVGGSTTDQRNITDGQTWQDVIQEEFQGIGKKVVLANAGVDGQSTFGHIKDFDWWFPEIPNLKPKYVIFYVGINDFYKDEGWGWDALVPADSTKSIRQLVKEKSALYTLWRTLKGIYKAEFDPNVGLSHRAIHFSQIGWTRTPLLSSDSYNDLMGRRLHEYAQRLNLLIDKTIDFDAIPIFVTQPSHLYRIEDGAILGLKKTWYYDSAKINGLDFYYMLRRLDNVTKSVCRDRNVICFDLGKVTAWDDGDFYDIWHMTPKGAKKVGRYLFDKLQEIVDTDEPGVFRMTHTQR